MLCVCVQACAVEGMRGTCMGTESRGCTWVESCTEGGSCCFLPILFVCTPAVEGRGRVGLTTEEQRRRVVENYIEGG